MRRLETVSLMISLNVDILFYHRYIDDICTAVSSSKIELFFYNVLIHFIHGGKKLNFLDTIIFISNNRFVFDWYRKPTFSERFLNFHSNHPIAQKKGTIFSIIDRAFLLPDFMFYTKNLTLIINILLDNDYPLTFIFDTVNQRIKNLKPT